MKRTMLLLPLFVVLAITACGPTQTAQPTTVTLRNIFGSVVGNVIVTEVSDGVKFSFQITGLPAGKHGWHLHAVGKCDTPDFTTAGAHFNPDNKKHGLQSADGSHAGDSDGLTVSADGAATFEYVNKRVKFAAGAANSVFQKDGLAIVVHATDDDQKTDPTGNSGGRIACGLILQ